MKKLIIFYLTLQALSTEAQTNIFPSSGNVGIGTIAPTSLLHVNNSSGLSSGNNFGCYINSEQMSATTGNVIGIIGYSKSSHASGNVTLGIGFSGNCELSSSGNVSIMRGVQGGAVLTGSGNVTDLSCFYGNIAAPGSGSITNGYGLYINNFPASVTNKYGVFINDGNAKNYFAGTLGIGTISTGSFKLAVEGMIGAREIQVTAASPWPDYVFKEDYQLMSIDSLKSFIRINNHLPNIPSAREISEKGGIQLGETNIKLLEKIEELTLYIIQLKNENDEIRQIIKNAFSPKN